MNWIDFSKTVTQRAYRIDLDKNQQKTKLNKLNAHTLVRGVAGSGKSLLLRKRIERIFTEANNYRILVLTYNRFMAGWIQALVPIASSNNSIDCRTFNSWAWHTLDYDYNTPASDFLQKTQLNTPKYNAILIDEAQDFKDEWFIGLMNLLDPQTNSLFVVYDNTQSVYGNPHRRRGDWSWSRLGINIVGRTDILDFNYRNSPEIGLSAWNFFLPFISRANVPISRDSPGAIIEPKFNKNRSSNVAVSLIHCNDYNKIAKEVALSLSQYPNSSIAIMMHPDIKNQVQYKVSVALTQFGVSHHAPQKSEDRIGNIVIRPCVIVDSWNSLKGVEFDAVILINIDYVYKYINASDQFENFSGLYTAMTRARDHLVMVYEQYYPMVSDISRAIDQANKTIEMS